MYSDWVVTSYTSTLNGNEGKTQKTGVFYDIFVSLYEQLTKCDRNVTPITPRIAPLFTPLTDCISFSFELWYTTRVWAAKLTRFHRSRHRVLSSGQIDMGCGRVISAACRCVELVISIFMIPIFSSEANSGLSRFRSWSTRLSQNKVATRF